MRYTRLKMKRALYSQKFRIIFEFFVILPILAVIIGGMITKILILPIAKNSVGASSKTGTELLVANSKKNTYNFYILQAGAFVKKENADILKHGINAIGKEPYVLLDKGIYRVIIDVEIKNDFLEETKKDMTSKGYNSLINEMNFTFNSNGERNNKALKEYMDSIFAVLEYQVNSKRENKISLDEIKTLKDDMNKSFNIYYESNQNSNEKAEVKKINDKLQLMLGEYYKNLEGKSYSLCYGMIVEELFLIKEFYELNKVKFVSNI